MRCAALRSISQYSAISLRLSGAGCSAKHSSTFMPLASDWMNKVSGPADMEAQHTAQVSHLNASKLRNDMSDPRFASDLSGIHAATVTHLHWFHTEFGIRLRKMVFPNTTVPREENHVLEP